MVSHSSQAAILLSHSVSPFDIVGMICIASMIYVSGRNPHCGISHVSGFRVNCYRACSFTLLFAQLFYFAKSNSHFIRFIPISFHMFIPISHMFSLDSSMLTMLSPYTLTSSFLSHNSHVTTRIFRKIYSSYTGGGIYSGGSG